MLLLLSLTPAFHVAKWMTSDTPSDMIIATACLASDVVVVPFREGETRKAGSFTMKLPNELVLMKHVLMNGP